jgi:hypothetical protein
MKTYPNGRKKTHSFDFEGKSAITTHNKPKKFYRATSFEL